MEKFLQIFEYLPLSYNRSDEEEYINFLKDSFEINYTQNKFQFAFIALHLLYMSYVYMVVWQLRKSSKYEFNNALVGFPREEEEMNKTLVSSPFIFHRINEKTIFRFFRLLGCNNEDINKYRTTVDIRNNASHSNGQVIIKSREILDDLILDTFTYIEEIHILNKIIIKEIYKNFLINSRYREKREYDDSDNQINEILIRTNYLSFKDLEQCLSYDINQLRKYKQFYEIQGIHNKLKTSLYAQSM